MINVWFAYRCVLCLQGAVTLVAPRMAKPNWHPPWKLFRVGPRLMSANWPQMPSIITSSLFFLCEFFSFF